MELNSQHDHSPLGASGPQVFVKQRPHLHNSTLPHPDGKQSIRKASRSLSGI